LLFIRRIRIKNLNFNTQLLVLAVISIFNFGCSGKYLVKSYPAGAKVYLRDINSNEKRLVGLSPVQIKEESRLGDVFFLVFEKNNYKPKEVMIRVNEGESLSVAAQLDPLTADAAKEQAAAGGDQGKGEPPPGQPPQGDKKEPKKIEELVEQVNELNLRVALLENTTSFYKDAMFSSRFQGGPANFDRDRNDKVIGYMFQAQQAIVNAKYDEALGLVDKAINIDEYVSNAWLLKGSIKYLQNDYTGAKDAWERCLKIDPHNKIAYRYLSATYKRLGYAELPNKPEELRYPASNVEIDKRNPKKK
jgi:tetratricopeptide (TPR) repeat protein